MKSVASPKIPADLTVDDGVKIHSGVQIEQIACENVVFTGVEAKNIELDTVAAENSEWSSCKFRKANLSDVILNNCLFFGTDFDGSGWRRVAVKSGMYSGLVMSDTLLEDVTFTGAKLNLANFRVAKLHNVEFKNCDLTEADFQSAEMRSVVFNNCNLAGVNFGHCKLHDVDLRTSDISTIQGIVGLRGATINLEQLISISQVMAAELGIKIDL